MSSLNTLPASTLQTSPLDNHSLCEIRIYTEGSMLAPRVDRNPLFSSPIINIVDEPYPRGDCARRHRNVSMLPGDLVIYESQSVIHGRQFHLKGKFMANV